MEDEADPCLWKSKKKNQTAEQEPESDDEKYGFGSKYRTGNNIKYKDHGTNDCHGKTLKNLMYAQDKIPDPDPKIVDKGHEYKLVYKKEERDSNLDGKDSADADHKADANSKVDIKDKANSKDEADVKTDANDETYAEADERDKANATKNTDATANTKDEADTRHKSDDYLKEGSDSGFGSKPVISLINLQKDCLVVYAIQSGKVAWRHPETGSWLLDELNEVLKEYTYPCSIPFLQILTKTAFKMAQRESSEGRFKAVPVIQHWLTKDILIPLKERQTYV